MRGPVLGRDEEAGEEAGGVPGLGLKGQTDDGMDKVEWEDEMRDEGIRILLGKRNPVAGGEVR